MHVLHIGYDYHNMITYMFLIIPIHWALLYIPGTCIIKNELYIIRLRMYAPFLYCVYVMHYYMSTTHTENVYSTYLQFYTHIIPVVLYVHTQDL